jgi:metal-responsive CopG/Arc/MetJ family transcriptional regulator
MPSIKTAISLPELLFQRADAIAHRLDISRSQLIARAVEDYLKRHESRLLLESLNRAYEDAPTSEEREQAQLMREKQRKRMDAEW